MPPAAPPATPRAVARTFARALGVALGTVAVAAAAPQDAPPVAPPDVPELRVAFAPDGETLDAMALSWLRTEVLAMRPEWPSRLRPQDPFTLHVDRAGVRVLPPLALPPGIAAAGTCALPGGAAILFACDEQGREDWFVTGSAAPAAWQRLLEVLHVDVDGAPRTVDPAALVGNLLGAVVDGDPERALLPLAAARCGEVTFAVRRQADGLHVRGDSHGGLLLPALAVWRASELAPAPAGEATLAGWQLRAFAARDGDRAEAARQLQRAGADGIDALRRLLHADESSRLAAIDGLLRLQATDELPRIVAAAKPQQPLTLAMAAAAVRELWLAADDRTRAATRRELQHNTVLGAAVLPELERMTRRAWRAWVASILFVLSMTTAGFWWRERCRLAAAT